MSNHEKNVKELREEQAILFILSIIEHNTERMHSTASAMKRAWINDKGVDKDLFDTLKAHNILAMDYMEQLEEEGAIPTEEVRASFQTEDDLDRKSKYKSIIKTLAEISHFSRNIDSYACDMIRGWDGERPISNVVVSTMLERSKYVTDNIYQLQKKHQSYEKDYINE